MDAMFVAYSITVNHAILNIKNDLAAPTAVTTKSLTLYLKYERVK